MRSLIEIKSWLGTDWIIVVAMLAGLVSRALKSRLPKDAVPYVSVVAGAIINALFAFIFVEPLLPAIIEGAAAGGISIGGHELLKRILGRWVGAEKASSLLGSGKS